MNRVLKLTLNKEWFDMIIKGIKIEEYREIKKYWVSRICKKYPAKIIFEGSDLIDKHSGDSFEIKKFELVEFTNGYNKQSPQVTFEIKDMTIGFGKTEWGAVEGVKYFVVRLGNEVGRLNC